MNVAVLGGGSTAYASAADLVLRGHSVKIFSQRTDELRPFRDAGGIEATGVISGFAPIDATPCEIGEMLEWAEIALLNVSAAGFETYARLIAQSIKNDQLIVSFGKGGASLILARVAREMGIQPRVRVAEGNSALYLCRRMEASQVWISHIMKEVRTAAFPSKDTPAVLRSLRELFPGHNFIEASHAVETILLDYNAMLHPGPMICNASTVERALSDFRLFAEENVTPSVVNIVSALDQERLRLSEALGIDAAPLEEEFHRLGFTEKGTPLQECLHTELLARLRGPFSLTERHLSEDVPYGLVAWCSLGELLGVATPVSHACCVLASVLNQEDYLSTGASLERMGIDRSWNVDQLRRFLREGLL